MSLTTPLASRYTIVKMNILMVGVAVIFIVVSAIVTRNRKTESNVLPAETSAPEATSSPSSTPSPVPAKTTTSWESEPTPEVSVGPSQFFYPGASIISQTSTSASLTSSDESAKITSWYEEKIKSMGFSAKAFVKTSSNSNVLNKLSGAKDGEKITIEIKREPGEPITQIEIKLDKD